MTQTILVVEGIYFILTGVWPLVHINSFLSVTGPKTDLWLVKTFGVLITSVGTSLLAASILDDQSANILLLGISSALFLSLADIYYVSRKVISPVYLIDAAIEIGIVIAFVLTR